MQIISVHYLNFSWIPNESELSIFKAVQALDLLEVSNLHGDPQVKPNLDSKLVHYLLHTLLYCLCRVTNLDRTDFTSLSFETAPQITLIERQTQMQSLPCIYWKSIREITLKYKHLKFSFYLAPIIFSQTQKIILIVTFSYFVLVIEKQSNLRTYFAMHRKFWPCSIYILLEFANLTILTMFYKCKNIHNLQVDNNNLITNN